jgi:glycosyltransferase involved in cell wall biosynthesis
MKVALVQDWFVVNGGAEKVVKEILKIYPSAEVFSLVDFFNDDDRKEILMGKKSRTSFLQHFPMSRKYYRQYLPFFPKAIESLDFSSYDLIISSSYAVAKGIKKTNSQVHICYCHSPARYVYDLKGEYLSSMSWILRWVSKPVLKYIERWDKATSGRVDYFIANSKHIAGRISRIYRRESEVIYPPVDITAFTPFEEKEDYYFTTMRVVPYKKLDLVVETFAAMPHRKLVVAGDGPDLSRIIDKSPSNIYFTGYVTRERLVSLMQRAKAFVLAAEEDFGITSLEAQSCLTPVIAYRKGGYLETVIEGKTGMFFDEQTPAALQNVIEQFEKNGVTSRPEDYLNHVKRFSGERFKREFKNFVERHVEG